MSQPYLEIHIDQTVNRFPLGEDPVMIGRQSDCTIVLTDSKSSRKHASVTLRGERYWVRDLESSNGTTLNGKRISAAPLSPGDVIGIGAATIRFADSSAGGEEEEVETLSAEDVVEVEEDAAPRGMPVLGGTDAEQSLETLANALPEQSVREGDIIFLNARGQALHEGSAERKKGAKREPVDLFRLLMLVCIRARATDIHLEPRSDGYQLRLRIDGSMVDVAKLPLQLGVRIATMVKVLSDIDIGQRNAMQEGHFAARVPSAVTSGPRRVDYRVSFAPSVFGQKLVVRILDAENAPLRLGDLSLPRWMYEALHEQTGSDAGMILVSGPTGSGKTTTLYSLLRSIELTRRNVVTIEDPVEVQIESTTQIPVDEEQGKTFSAILRSVLRQDPDVIMLGEIRDAETARTAMQAAMTGHMVLSTIHTRDTLGSVFRLLDLGVEPFLVSQGLHVVVAQRLARQLCPFCRKKVAPTDEQRAAMGGEGEKVEFIYTPVGCTRCLGTGHAGRRAFFELLRTNEALREVILHNPSMADLQKTLAGTPFVPLMESGYQLVSAGLAAFDEIERIVGRAGQPKT